MPLLAFGKERLDPDLALAHRFGIGLRLVISAHPLQIRLGEVPVQLPTVVTGRALCFERAGIAGDGAGPVLGLLGLVLAAIRTEELAVWASIHILRDVVGEVGGSEVGGHVLPVGEWYVGADAHILNSLDVLEGSVRRVAG